MLMAVAIALSGVAATGHAVIPNPTLSGPIAATAPAGDASRNYPFLATILFPNGSGYVEEEFFVEGTAKRYSGTCTSAGCLDATAQDRAHAYAGQQRQSLSHPHGGATAERIFPLQRQGDRRVVQRDEQLGARRPVVSLRGVLHAPRLRLRRRRRAAGRHQRHAEWPSRVEPGALRHASTSAPTARSPTTRSSGTSSARSGRPSSRPPASIRCKGSPDRAR